MTVCRQTERGCKLPGSWGDGERAQRSHWVLETGFEVGGSGDTWKVWGQYLGGRTREGREAQRPGHSPQSLKS